MKPNLKINDSRHNRVFGQLAAEKKKTFVALCLIGVMALMWVRVLGKKTPHAEAALMTQQPSFEEQSSSKLKISFIELPKVPGRNDVLTGNFFAAKGWKNFMPEQEGGNLPGGQEGNVVSADDSQGAVTLIAEELRLQAIGLSNNPRAFINDKLLGVGDKLLVTDGVNEYECQITGIEENMVFVRCGQKQIKLRLATDD